MTEGDRNYVEMLLIDRAIESPMLELGAGYGGSTCRELAARYAYDYHATDIAPSHGVDFVADFSDARGVSAAFGRRQFGCVLVLNVLEHTFDPIIILDNALALTKEGGHVVVITPATWSLHKYPIDCCRLLPDWYIQYSLTRDCTLIRKFFWFIGVGEVDRYVDDVGNHAFPVPYHSAPVRRWFSRLIHKLFNTFGRGMAFPSHIAIGAVLQKRMTSK